MTTEEAELQGIQNLLRQFKADAETARRIGLNIPRRQAEFQGLPIQEEEHMPLNIFPYDAVFVIVCVVISFGAGLFIGLHYGSKR